MIEVLRVFAILCVALVMGKLVARVRLPAILGWLIAGVVFGPYLAGVVTLDMMDTTGFSGGSLWQRPRRRLSPLSTNTTPTGRSRRP